MGHKSNLLWYSVKVKIGKSLGVCVYRRSYLLWSPATVDRGPQQCCKDNLLQPSLPLSTDTTHTKGEKTHSPNKEKKKKIRRKQAPQGRALGDSIGSDYTVVKLDQCPGLQAGANCLSSLIYPPQAHQHGGVPCYACVR